MTKQDKAIKIKEKTTFKCGHLVNAENIAMALCKAGYFVRISSDDSHGYEVLVYQYI